MGLPGPLKNNFPVAQTSETAQPSGTGPLIKIAEESFGQVKARPSRNWSAGRLAIRRAFHSMVNAHEQGVANTDSGRSLHSLNNTVTANPQDVEGVVVHELAHAIQRGAKYGGEFTWMVEGLADFVRYKLGYGILLPGDPRRELQGRGQFLQLARMNSPGPPATGSQPGTGASGLLCLCQRPQCRYQARQP